MESYVRYLTESDKPQIEDIEKLMHNYITEWSEIEEALWGIFNNDKLIGVCTVGYAEGIGESVYNYPGWTMDSLVISNVYVKAEHRHQGVGSKLITKVLDKHSGVEGNLVFLTIMHTELSEFYGKLGFELIDDYSMVYNKGVIM